MKGGTAVILELADWIARERPALDVDPVRSRCRTAPVLGNAVALEPGACVRREAGRCGTADRAVRSRQHCAGRSIRGLLRLPAP
jgi:hypothetical protein